MFLQKIEKLAADWDKQAVDLEGVARESLLYGMRLIRHPSALKKELKKVQIDSKLARILWSGNEYLLNVLPEVLCNRKKKIPCLSDLLYARRTLSKDHLKVLRVCRKKRCKIPTEELFAAMMPKIRHQTWRGRFIPQFDAMNENLKDVEHDLIVEALEVLNKEMSNFRTTNKDEITNYLRYCLEQKSNTYLRRHTPKATKARIEQEDFERVAHLHMERMLDCREGAEFSDLDFQSDLKTFLTPLAYRGISLLMQFASTEDSQGFARYLRTLNIKSEWLTQTQLKNHIEKYLGRSVFVEVLQNPELKNFLLNRIEAPVEGEMDALNRRYA